MHWVSVGGFCPSMRSETCFKRPFQNKMNENLTIELDFYKRNPSKLTTSKEHIVYLYGLEGYTWLLAQILPIKKKSSCKRLEWLEYRKEVRRLTELQPLHTLENFELRGFTSMHVDHIVSIRVAFKNGWTTEQCADISNLQMLHYVENMRKGQ